MSNTIVRPRLFGLCLSVLQHNWPSDHFNSGFPGQGRGGGALDNQIFRELLTSVANWWVLLEGNNWVDN